MPEPRMNLDADAARTYSKRVKEAIQGDTNMNSPVEESTLQAVGILDVPKVKVNKRAFDYKKRAQFASGEWREPEYDLHELLAAISTEPYFRKAIELHTDKIIQSGWSLIGKSSKAKAYVFERIREMEMGMDMPFQSIVEQAIWSFVGLSNSFLYWVRENVNVSTRPKTYKGRFNREVGDLKGLFSIPAEMMRPITDDKGNISKWVQVDRHGVALREWLTRDLVHLTNTLRPGFIFGTPFIVDTLEDCKALRRTEELSEVKNHKLAFPWVHAKVGHEKAPLKRFKSGGSEITDISDKIAGMDTAGALVTDWRVELEALDISGAGIDLVPYLEYWEQRLFTGLGMDSIESGRGEASRSAAVELSSTGMKRSRRFQHTFERLFTFYIIDEILMEGGFALNPENRVFFQFNEIDREERAIDENHATVLFNSGLITHDEARIALGRDPFTDDQFDETVQALFTMPMEQQSIEGKKEIKRTPTPGTGTGSAKATANRNQPTNQFGTKLGRTKPVNASAQEIIENLEANTLDKLFESIYDEMSSRVDSDSLEEDFRRILSNFSLDGFDLTKAEVLLKLLNGLLDKE